jgi:hypothetical protein
VAARPGPVRDVSAVPGATSAKVTWQPPLSDGGSPITGYEVIVESCADQVILTRVVTSTNLEVGGLTDGRRYCIHVKARNARGQSPGSVDSNASVTPGEPTAPQSCSMSVVRWPDGRRDLAITWTAPVSFGGYRPELYVVRIYRIGVLVLSLTTEQLSQVVPSLGSGVYHATVRAQNTAGFIGPMCTTATVTIP